MTLETEPLFLRTISPDWTSTLPSNLTTPVPFGVSAIFPLDVETKALPFTSKSPPNCGVVSSTTSVIVPAAKPLTIVFRVTLFKPPPEVSTARKTSSLAIELISERSPTAVDANPVPFAINKLPEVFVAV